MHTLKNTLQAAAKKQWFLPLCVIVIVSVCCLFIAVQSAILFGQIEQSEAKTIFTLVLAAALALACVFTYVFYRRVHVLHADISQDRVDLLRLNLHKIGTPLTILRWTAESLHERFDGVASKDEVLRDDLQALDDVVQRIAAVHTQLRNADSVESGVELVSEACSVKQVIDLVLMRVTPEFQRKKQELQLQFDIADTMHIAKKPLETILVELLRNASVYSTEATTTTLHVSSDAQEIVCTVIDQGIGIPEQDLPTICRKFTRGSNATLMDTEGTGFGLFIAKGLAQKAGGTLDIDSKEQSGTTVTLRLPLEKKS